MTAAILHTKVGRNASKDESDTLMQVEAVSKCLNERHYTVVQVACALEIPSLIASLKEINPDIVFNLVEPLQGEGQFIHLAPMVLEYLEMPYTGCSSEAVYLTSNKVLAKKLLRTAGIPTPRWAENGNNKHAHGGACSMQTQFIIKSVWEHASVGIEAGSVVLIKGPGELSASLESKSRLCKGKYFAEEYIDGREFNISLLSIGEEVEVLPPAEMKFLHFPENRPKVLGYRAKWDEESTEYLNTQRSFDFGKEDEPLLATLTTLSTRCWDTFGLNGYARVDFRVDRDNNPYVLEINANPCISPSSGFVAAAKRAGLSYGEMIERIMGSPVFPP